MSEKGRCHFNACRSNRLTFHTFENPLTHEVLHAMICLACNATGPSAETRHKAFDKWADIFTPITKANENNHNLIISD